MQGRILLSKICAAARAIDPTLSEMANLRELLVWGTALRRPLAVAGALFLAYQPACAASAEEPELNVNWDATPPMRSGALGGYAELVRAAAPSVVAILIQVPDDAREPGRRLPGTINLRAGTVLAGDGEFETDGIGSGVILSSDGYILTSTHVVERAEEIRILISGRETPLTGTLVGMDELTDIAVIKVDANDLPAAKLSKAASLSVGDVVLTIGNPFGLEHTVTSGIISGLGRKNLIGNPLENLIQTDAAINPGSSGGALIDNRGRVIGITGAMISEDGQNAGVGFAEPIESAVEIARELIADGHVRRGYTGATYSALSQPLAEVFGAPSTAGAVVAEVDPGSPAEAASLVPGDVILRFGETVITDPQQLVRLIAQVEPGIEQELMLVRYGEQIRTQLEVVPMPPGGRPRGRAENLPDGSAVLDGLTLAEIDPGARIYFGIPPETSGVIVAEIDPVSPVAGSGIGEGDVILQIGKEPVASIAQAIAARSKIRGSKILLRVLAWDGVKFIVLHDETR